MRSLPAPGFTLIELAIVLFVISLLLGGVLTPLGQQIAEHQNRETRRTMENARIALVGYALSHPGNSGMGHLPCPDMRTAGPVGEANDGQEDRKVDGGCATQAGNLPWVTLGLAEGDAWGNRLGYAVAANWSWSGTPADTPIEDTPIQICADMRCEHPMSAAAILISHGRNGFGALNMGGGINLAPSHAEELENINSDSRFIMHPPRAADRPGGDFDDIIAPISTDWLRGRLCDPASLCQASTSR